MLFQQASINISDWPVVIAVVPAEGAAVPDDLLDVVEGQEAAQLHTK